MKLQQALATLDPLKDEHWTSDGLPRVDAISALCGQAVSRRDITNEAPSYTRTKAQGGGGFAPVGTPEEGDETAPEPPAPAAPEDAPDAPEAPTEEPAAPEEAPATEPDPPAEDAPAEEPAPAEEAAPAEAPTEPPAEGMTPGEAPEEDPTQAAYVEPLDDVVAMSPQQVFRDLELVDRAIDEFGRQAAILTARREAILVQLKDVGRRSAMLASGKNKLERMGAKSKKPSTIQNYLKAQQKAREERALRARRFIAAGTTVEDVKQELGGPSKIDSAMKQRKVSRGARRPAYPVTANR